MMNRRHFLKMGFVAGFATATHALDADLNCDGKVDLEDLAILCNQWMDEKQKVKIGIITDVHSGDHSEPETRIWEGEQRWYSNARMRMGAFAIDMESAGVDFCIDLGDVVDDQTSHPGAKLAVITYPLKNFYTGDVHYLIGNHETAIWNADWTDYEAQISQTPPNMGDYWTAGKPAEYPVTHTYSFDTGGIHFVVLGDIGSDYQQAQRAWLSTNLSDTSLPIVVFSHAHLHAGAGVMLARRLDYAEIQAILEVNNVQAVIQGHQHPIPRLANFCYVINEIPYYNLRGNLLGPMDGSTPVRSDAADYLFEIIPDAVEGENRMKANIKITCSYIPQEAVNSASMNKEFDKYCP